MAGAARDRLLVGDTERPGRVLTGEMSTHVAVSVPILTFHISHDLTLD